MPMLLQVSTGHVLFLRCTVHTSPNNFCSAFAALLAAIIISKMSIVILSAEPSTKATTLINSPAYDSRVLQ